jgi:hypothetical protein
MLHHQGMADQASTERGIGAPSNIVVALTSEAAIAIGSQGVLRDGQRTGSQGLFLWSIH